MTTPEVPSWTDSDIKDLRLVIAKIIRENIFTDVILSGIAVTLLSFVCTHSKYLQDKQIYTGVDTPVDKLDLDSCTLITYCDIAQLALNDILSLDYCKTLVADLTEKIEAAVQHMRERAQLIPVAGSLKLQLSQVEHSRLVYPTSSMDISLWCFGCNKLDKKLKE